MPLNTFSSIDRIVKIMAGYMVKANEGESATMTNLLLMEFIRNMPEYTDLSKREEQVSVKLTDDDETV